MTKLKILLLALLVVALRSRNADAYPEFIGYGYSSCLTCHNNGLGGGSLSDYGRALWSAEIASRWLYPKSMSDEQIAAQSGFLGSYELPYWIRPDAKYRGMYLQTNPNSSAQTDKFYNMQGDFGVALQDKVGKYLLELKYGYMVAPNKYGAGTSGLERILAKEYYLRVEAVKTWWIYAGLMDKVFGLRNVDHSSYQRMNQGFNPSNNTIDGISQSESVVVHKVEDKWEVAASAFFGNPYDDQVYKQSGYSLWSEFSVGENKRFGASLMSETSSSLAKQLGAIHYRQQLSKGSAVMSELGLIEDQAPSSNLKVGSYALLQTLVLITRGYNLKATVERYNREFNSASPEQWIWSAGMLAFPAPRLELRFDVLNMRSISSQGSTPDSWAVEGQVHVSL